jgi:hypothetical protein
MALQGPRPGDEPIAAVVAEMFRAAGADWTMEVATRPALPGLCSDRLRPASTVKGRAAPAAADADRWLPQAFPATVLDLANRLDLDARGRVALRDALHAAKLQTARVLPRVAALTSSAKGVTTVVDRTIGRRDACSIMTAYLAPLLDPRAYRAWLDEMTGSQMFLRGADPAGPQVPESVFRRERLRDNRLAEQWAGDRPVPPQTDKLTVRARATAERRYQQRLAEYERRRRQAEAFLPSEPAAPGGVPAADQGRRLAGFRAAAAARPLPLIVVGGAPAPANLFISEAAAPIQGYLALLDPVLQRAAAPLDLYGPLLGLAYGALALALVPVHCLYDNYHGTCTIERLLPDLLSCAAVLRGYSGRTLRQALPDRLRRPSAGGDPDTEAVNRVLDGYGAWTAALGEAVVGNLVRLVRVAGEQTGGRVRTPENIAPGARWTFTLHEPNDDGSVAEVRRTVPESISYLSQARQADEEVFWMLRALWGAVGTAVALVNQAGMTLWFNAANNRWGGHHPPHSTHRQGYSLDIDVGFGWRPGHKVPNVKKRDTAGRPRSDQEEPDNSKNHDCLHGVNRLAGWVVTQAFVLIGVSQYLYGDAQLVEEASGHLIDQLATENLEVSRPARMNGVVDAGGHFDHWHFEVLVGPRAFEGALYTWAVPRADLLDLLRAWAVRRDQDPAFWKKIAGLDKVPTSGDDFKHLTDAADWQEWWKLRTAPGGIPLLPVWAPSRAADTFGAGECWDPEEDTPAIFAPGEAAA